MEFQLEHLDGRLLASGEMTIYHAASMKTALLARWPGGTTDVALDLANVTELDTCGLQMLIMVQQLARSEGRSVVVVATSAAVREVLELCGLREWCGESEAA